MRLAGLHGNKCSIPERVAQRRAILPLWADTWRQELLAQLRQGYVVGGSEIPEIPFKHETKLLFSEGGQQRNGFPEEVVGHTPLEIEKKTIRSATCSGWLCLEKGVGLGGFQRCLQTSTTLWFYEREAHKVRPQAENDVAGIWQQALEEPCRYTKRKELLFLSSPSHPSTPLLC